MSSVRISQHNRATVPASPGGVTAKGEAPSSGLGFALALGAAALVPKEPGAALFGAAAKGTADDTSTSRKRTGGDGKSGETAAMLAAQTSLLAVVGQVPIPDAVAAHATPSVGSASDPQNPFTPGAAQPDANVPPASIASAVDVAKSLSPPGDATIAAPGPNFAADPPAAALTIDAGDPGPTPGDAAADPSGALSNIGPGLPATPSLNPPASPPPLVGIAQAMPPAAAAEPNASSGDAASGRDSRERPMLALSNGARAAETVAFGAPGEAAALANAPPAAASPATAANTIATVPDQVASQVVQLISSGSREMVMRLHPPELGEVTVRVVVNGRDVSAWFGTPQPHVQAAIADGIGQLQTGLGSAGYNLNGAWVGTDASGSRQQAGNSPPAASTPVAGGSLDAQMTAASRPPASGLNIYV